MGGNFDKRILLFLILTGFLQDLAVSQLIPHAPNITTRGHRIRRQVPSPPNSILNVPIPTALSFYPGSSEVIDACDRDKVSVKGVGCYQLLQQGPCSVTQMVLLDSNTNNGYCGPRLCPPDRVFIFGDQQCYDPRTPKICPPGRQLFLSAYGTPVCGCPDGTYESSDNLNENVCEPILTSSLLCPKGQVQWFRAPGQRLECLPDPCGGLNTNRAPNDLPYITNSQGSCPQLAQSTGVCNADTWYSLATDNLIGTCATLQQAGYTVLKPDTLTAIMQQFGNPISTDLTPPIPVAPSGTSPIGGNTFAPNTNSIATESKPPTPVISSATLPTAGNTFVSNAGTGASINTGIMGNAGIQSNQGHFGVPMRPFLEADRQTNFAQGLNEANFPNIQGQTTMQQHGLISPTPSHIPSFTSSNVDNIQGLPIPLRNQGGTFPTLTPHRFSQDTNLGAHRFSSLSVLQNNDQTVKSFKQQGTLNQPVFGIDESSQIHTGNFQESPSSFVFQNNAKPVRDFTTQGNLNQPLFGLDGSSQIHTSNFQQSGFGGNSFNSHHNVFSLPTLIPFEDEIDIPAFELHQSSISEPAVDFSELIQLDSDESFVSNLGITQQDFEDSFGQASVFDSQSVEITHGDSDGSNWNNNGFVRRHQEIIPSFSHVSAHTPSYLISGYLPPQRSRTSHRRHIPSLLNIQPGLSLSPNDGLGSASDLLVQKGVKIVAQTNGNGRIDNASIQPSGRNFSDYIERVKLLMHVLPVMQDERRIRRSLPKKRTRRNALLHASPGNVFEPRLMSCKPGAARQINAKCRNVILPPRYPPRRTNRAAPPIRPGAQCPRATVRDARRRCVNRQSATNSLISSGLG